MALKCGMQRTKTTSMASATTATSKDESTQELSQAKNIIDAQRLENFSLTQELIALKAELASVKAQVVTAKVTTIFIAPPVEPVLPLQGVHQNIPDTGGEDIDVPQEQDPWASWSSAGASERSWFQSELDIEMEKRNKHYAERNKESLSLAKSL